MNCVACIQYNIHQGINHITNNIINLKILSKWYYSALDRILVYKHNPDRHIWEGNKYAAIEVMHKLDVFSRDYLIILGYLPYIIVTWVAKRWIVSPTTLLLRSSAKYVRMCISSTDKPI